MIRALLLEDDYQLGEKIQAELSSESFQVTWAKSLSELASLNLKPQVAICDLNLPDGSGFEALSNLNCPVIITSALNTPENRLKCIQLGVVDFIPKPFLIKELTLKINRVLQEDVSVIDVNSCKIDLLARSIEQKSGDLIFLADREFKVLQKLIISRPEVISRDDILNLFSKSDMGMSHRSIDNIVVKLRSYLLDESHQVIRSVRGVGYQWPIAGIKK